MRLDLYLAEKYPRYSRSVLQKLIRAGKVRVGGKVVSVARKDLTDGAKVDIELPEASDFSGRTLPVIYEDDNVIVIDKPAGVLTHSKGALNDEFTVADFITTHSSFYQDSPCNDSEAICERHCERSVAIQKESDWAGLPHPLERVQSPRNDREGIVHRLDRGTSGVIIGAKNQATRKMLQKQFQDRKVKKTYIAVVNITTLGQKSLDKNGAEFTIDLPIARNPKNPSQFKVDARGKSAITDVKLVQVLDGDRALLELKPHTGRTHQLRVHLAHIGLPIVGDVVYNTARDDSDKALQASSLQVNAAGFKPARMMLHARELEITIPGGERKKFTAELPDEFA
jgi:23S rRNA pseudouridine1911/1915/1917 synthase